MIRISFVNCFQDEIMSSSGQIEPPGMHMIYLPYSDDIRPITEVIVLLFTFLMGEFNIDDNMVGLQLHTNTIDLAPRASDDQIKSATSLVKRIDLKNFSVCQFANPGNLCFMDCHVKHGCALLYLMSIVHSNGELIFWKDKLKFTSANNIASFKVAHSVVF